MVADHNWARWCFASAAYHFQQQLAALDPTLQLYVEGQKRNTRLFKTFVEFRLDGPNLTEVSQGCWRIYGEVNLLVQATLDESDTQLIHRTVGLATAAFSDISVYRYGDTADDDDSFVFCWKLLQSAGTRDPIQVAHYGIIEPDLKLTQATVEGHYEIKYNP